MLLLLMVSIDRSFSFRSAMNALTPYGEHWMLLLIMVSSDCSYSFRWAVYTLTPFSEQWMLLLLTVSSECRPRSGQVDFYPVLLLDCLLSDWLAVRACRSGWAYNYWLIGWMVTLEKAISGHVGCSHNSVLNKSKAQCTNLYKKYGMCICSKIWRTVTVTCYEPLPYPSVLDDTSG